jgi:ATP-dependent exoDNAse (exonuclease V) beta subunit
MQDDAPEGQDAGFGKTREFKGALFDEDDYDKKSDVFKETGIAYHAFLEFFDFALLYDGDSRVDESLLRARIQTVLAELTQNKSADVSLLQEDKLVDILQNPVFNELRGAKLYKERQFLVGLPACETYVHTAKDVCVDEEVLFQGAIDLLAVGETVRIVDYKYSQKDAEYLRAHYKPQLDLYKKATAKILRIDEKQIRCTIVNICKGFQVEMD